MDLLQNINPAHVPLIAVGCALLCAVLVVIGFLLQALGSIFDVIAGLVEIVVEIMQGGPVAWCGCTLLVIGLFACAGFTFLYLNAPESCAANPTPFCYFFGFLCPGGTLNFNPSIGQFTLRC